MKRQPFFNGWAIWSLTILAACIIAPISEGDVLTWSAWIGCLLIVLGGRGWQYFHQGR